MYTVHIILPIEVNLTWHKSKIFLDEKSPIFPLSDSSVHPTARLFWQHIRVLTEQALTTVKQALENHWSDVRTLQCMYLYVQYPYVLSSEYSGS